MKKLLKHLELCVDVVYNHRCENPDHGFDMECELAERIKILLVLNGYFRKYNGAIKIGAVEQLLDEGNANAILLLAGDKRQEAKEILVNCIIDSKKISLFYKQYENLLPIGPFFILFSGDIKDLLNLFEKGIGELWGCENLSLVSHLFSERLFLHYGEEEDSMDMDFSIVRKVEKTVREVCGRSLFSDPDLIHKIYGSMLAEGTRREHKKIELLTSQVVSIDKEYDKMVYFKDPKKEEWESGYIDCFDLPGFKSGNHEYYILLDPENWKEKYAEICNRVK
ncbi:MAG: hypothetical protein WAV31_05995 [Candidatus Moraniibacteriota bacterium]